MPEQIIQPGTYTWPFQFQIPSNVPSSFQGRHGQIQYALEATVKRSWKFDYTTMVPFTVNSIVDLNTWPGVVQPVNMQDHKYICCLCCKSGTIHACGRWDLGCLQNQHIFGSCRADYIDISYGQNWIRPRTTFGLHDGM